jgi:hypothetical protein
MRTKLIALALAAMLTVGTGGVAAAGASSTAEAQLPDDYTVEVTDPFEDLPSDEVDEAIETAWSNDRVRSAVEASDDLHFEVVADTEQVEVQVAPGPDADERVVAEIGPDGTVTDVFEPSTTADASNVRTVDLDDTEFDVTETEDGETVEWIDTEEVETMEVDPDETVVVEDGETGTWTGVGASLTTTIDVVGELLADGVSSR